MKKAIITLLITAAAASAFIIIINIMVIRSTSHKIVSADDSRIFDADCILVLGAGVYDDGTPTLMLKGRLEKTVELYKSGAADKIIMSGDNVSENYDEVHGMKKYAVNAGIKSEDIYLDHAGVSTYDSVYRLSKATDVKKVIIVSQRYHLYRALYIAEKLGIEAIGVADEYTGYSNQLFQYFRESFARIKDFFKCIAKPECLYEVNCFSLEESGDLTD